MENWTVSPSALVLVFSMFSTFERSALNSSQAFPYLVFLLIVLSWFSSYSVPSALELFRVSCIFRNAFQPNKGFSKGDWNTVFCDKQGWKNSWWSILPSASCLVPSLGRLLECCHQNASYVDLDRQEWLTLPPCFVPVSGFDATGRGASDGSHVTGLMLGKMWSEVEIHQLITL